MIICADDFGLRSDVDDAIDELCVVGRLSAVSCMVGLARCSAESCRSLRRHEPAIDLGLHLCLTREEAKPENGLRAPASGLPALIGSTLSRRITVADWKQEISDQFELFVRKFGRPPDYIDGHLHAHQLPVVRAGLTAFLSELPLAPRPYVRNTATRTRDLISAGLPWPKAAIVGWFGARLRAQLVAAGIDTNSGFFGIYDFAKFRKFPEYLPGFLACSRDVNSILVVHPGRAEEWRRQELECLQQFKALPERINRYRRAGPARAVSGAGL